MTDDKKSKSFNPFIFLSESDILIFLITIFSIITIYTESKNLMYVKVSLLNFITSYPIIYKLIDLVNPELLIILFLIISLALFLIKPYISLFRLKLKKLEDVTPGAFKEIDSLVKDAGIKDRAFILYLDSSNIEIFTLGTVRKKYIILTKGFLEKFFDKKDEFNAIIYHEISHIKNKDLFKTELSLSFLYTFIFFNLTFFIIHLSNLLIKFVIYGPYLSLPSNIGISSQQNNIDMQVINGLIGAFNNILWFVILVYLIIMLIRYMEIYADLRTIRYIGDEKPLLNALTRFQAMSFISKRKFGFISIPKNIISLKYHPSIKMRKNYINDPLRILKFRALMPVIVGIMAYMTQNLLLNNYTVTSLIPLDVPKILNFEAFVFIVVLISLIMLLPRIISSVIFLKTKKIILETILLSQLFVIGFMISNYIFVNLPMILQFFITNGLFLYENLFTNSHTIITYSYSYMGTKYSVFNPVPCIILGEFYAFHILLSILLFIWASKNLIQAYSIKEIFKYPNFWLILIPASICALTSCLFFGEVHDFVKFDPFRSDIGYILSILLILSLIIIPVLIRMQFSRCPVCKNKVYGKFSEDIICTKCNFDIGKNNILFENNDRILKKFPLKIFIIALFMISLIYAGVLSYGFISPFLREKAIIENNIDHVIALDELSTYRGGYTHNANYQTEGLKTFNGIKWKVETNGTIRSSPLIYKNKIYFGSNIVNEDYGYYYSVDMKNGYIIWKQKIDGGMRDPPTIINDTIYLFGDLGTYVLNASNGEILNKIDYSYASSQTPIIYDDKLFFGGGVGYFYAYDLKTGEKIWGYKGPGPANGKSSRPLMYNDTIYVSDFGGNLFALDADTGNPEWTYKFNVFEDPQYFEYEENGTQIDQTLIYGLSEPCIEKGVIYFGDQDGYLHALDADNGNEKWKFLTKGWVMATPVVSNDTVYFGSLDERIYACDVATGKEKWRFKTDGWIMSGPVYADGIVYCGSYDSYLYAIEADTGYLIKRFKTHGFIETTPLVDNGTLYLGTHEGILFALN